MPFQARRDWIAGLVTIVLVAGPMAHTLMAHPGDAAPVVIEQPLPANESPHMFCAPCTRVGSCVLSCGAAADRNGLPATPDGRACPAAPRAGDTLPGNPVHCGYQTRAPPHIPIQI